MLVQDKVVVVSGIGPGLGSKLALHAAIEGCRGVVVSARRTEGLDAAEEAIAATGTGCAVLKQVNDIRDMASCEALVAATVERFGRIDALVNNAFGHGPSDTAENADLDGWHDPFDTNVVGTMKISRAVIAQMKTQDGDKSIVNINTMGARTISTVPETGYCISKAALAYATKQLAYEVGKYGVRVNGVHPGFMWGEPVKRHFRLRPEMYGEDMDAAYAMVAERMALKRIATDDEVARAALFLASEYASAITGVALDANAGNYLP